VIDKAGCAPFDTVASRFWPSFLLSFAVLRAPAARLRWQTFPATFHFFFLAILTFPLLFDLRVAKRMGYDTMRKRWSY